MRLNMYWSVVFEEKIYYIDRIFVYVIYVFLRCENKMFININKIIFEKLCK